MTSLKGYIPALARLLGTTPAALYERQRALVNVGLLDQTEGRGPGSGVRATAPAVAMLLLAILASDRLAESASRAGAIAGIRPRANAQCPYTGMKTFLEALSVILFSDVAEWVMEIEVSRTAERARIKFYDRKTKTEQISEFVGAQWQEPYLSVSAKLSHAFLLRLAADVQP